MAEECTLCHGLLDGAEVFRLTDEQAEGLPEALKAVAELVGDGELCGSCASLACKSGFKVVSRD